RLEGRGRTAHPAATHRIHAHLGSHLCGARRARRRCCDYREASSALTLGEVAACGAEASEETRVGGHCSGGRVPIAGALHYECELEFAAEAEKTAEQVGGYIGAEDTVTQGCCARGGAEIRQRREYRAQARRGRLHFDVAELITVGKAPEDLDPRTKPKNPSIELARIGKRRSRYRRRRKLACVSFGVGPRRGRRLHRGWRSEPYAGERGSREKSQRRPSRTALPDLIRDVLRHSSIVWGLLQEGQGYP